MLKEKSISWLRIMNQTVKKQMVARIVQTSSLDKMNVTMIMMTWMRVTMVTAWKTNSGNWRKKLLSLLQVRKLFAMYEHTIV